MRTVCTDVFTTRATHSVRTELVEVHAGTSTSSVRTVAAGFDPINTLLRAALLWLALAAPAFAQTVTTLPNFAQRYTTNASGDIRIVGNTVMTCSGANCGSTVLDGTTGTAANLNNNNQTMVNVDVDTSDAGLNGYNNSSSASFTLPPGATILKAFLYWYAEGASASVTTQRGQVKLRTSGVGSYSTVTAGAIYQQAAPGAGVGYASVADVTSLVPQGSTTFTVAGIATQSGTTDTYGGWSLVLVLADPAEPFRKLTVFDGLKAVGSGAPVTINLNLGANATPPAGAVSMRMGVVAGEGDRGTTGDALAVRSYASPGLAPNAYTTLANESGATNNFFNSSITRIGAGGASENVAAKDPNYINNLGVDMDVFEVPNAGNAVIQNSTNALDINLTSTGDVYLPSVVTTAVQLYVPNVQQSMTKSVVDVNGGDVLPGDLLEYTIAFSNTGGDYADAVTLQDAIPANTTYVAGSMVITGPNAGTKDDATNADQAELLTSGCAPVAAPCVRARLGVGATGSAGGTINPQPQANNATSFKFRVQVNAGVAPGTAINNTASVSYTARTLAQSFTVSSPAAATTSGAANLRLTKTHVGDFTQGQSNATYTIKVINDGGVTTAPFTVTDTLPVGLSFVSGNGVNWSCTAVGQSVSCDNNNAAPLALAGSSTLTLLVNVAPTAASPLVNNASVSGGGENAGTSGNNSASDSTTIAGAPNLTITKTANATPWTTGQTGRTYTVTVANGGTAPTTGTVTVVDTPPSGMTVTAIAGTGWTCTLGTRTCTRSDALGAGQSYAAITVTVTTPATAGVVDNVATVSGGGELYSADNSATRPTTITTSARDLTITKSHGGNFYQGQSGATYTLTVTNVGSALTGTPTTTVSEAPPAGMTITAISGINWSCSAPAGPCTRASDLASAASFEPITVTVNVANNAGTPLINQASVAVAGELAAQQGNNTASDSTVIEPTIDLALAKTASSATPQPGVPFSYTITVTNSGSIAASGVTVLDLLPGGLTLSAATASQGSYNSGNGVWNVGAVGVGGNATLTLNVTAASVGPIGNSAEVLSATERDRDSTPGNGVAAEDDQASVTVTVTAPSGGSGVTLSGFVYADADHNARKEAGEGGSGLVLYAKLVSAASPSGPALQAVAVDGASGAYAFTAVAAGEYTVLIDDNATLADVSGTRPAAWSSTEATGFERRNVVVASTDVSALNFGLFNGHRISGQVFNDNGLGGGAANNGTRDGAEAGLPNIALRLMNGGTAIDSTTTDGGGRYTLWVSAALAGAPLKVLQDNATGWLSTGGATVAGYDRASDSHVVSYSGTADRSGFDFGDVKVNTLIGSQQSGGVPGSVVWYAHRFDAASAGTVTLSLNSVWPSALRRDANCNGLADAADAAITNPIVVNSGDSMCLLVAVSVPAGAAPQSSDRTLLRADFAYTNAAPALTATLTNDDTTLVLAHGGGALMLVKQQDNAAPLPGGRITYTIIYTNTAASALRGIRVADATPPYTRFVSAACGLPLPAGISACSVGSSPAVGAGGAIEWVLAGDLLSAASGSVQFTVELQTGP
jgi:uncharacterized repeat protein (TIGR01451 family)